MTNQPELPAPVQPYQPVATDPVLALVERAARDPGVDVDKMERLLAMAERMNAKKAEAEYDNAMNLAQSEMRPVARDSENPQTRSRYASYGALDNAVRPIYTAHGFSLSFGTRSPCVDVVTVTCRVSHRAGHTERVEVNMPADGKGAKGGDVMTRTHATGSALSYGQRYLLKLIFNIAIGEYDDDGNAAGGKPAQRPAQTRQRPAPAPAKQTDQTGKQKDGAAWDKFLAACKAKLLLEANTDFYWAWWRYGIDHSWIMPGESLAEAHVDKIFEGFDRANPKDSIKNIVEMHRQEVANFASSCSVDLRNEILRAAVPLPKSSAGSPTSQPEGAIGKTASRFGCLECGSTATKQNADYEGVRWCEKCGHQWDSGGQPFEAHAWMWARLPLTPKDPDKQDYKGKTLGQLSRIDSKYWYGIVMNYEARGFNGRPPSKESKDFESACLLAREHLQAVKKVEETAQSDYHPNDANDDDVPF